MDKLTAMRTFVTVAKTGGFSAAAQVLSVPKTRVSQRIQELEAVLLVRLLHRTTRVVSLTDEGRRQSRPSAAHAMSLPAGWA